MRVAIVSDSHQGMVHLKRFVQYCREEKIEQVIHLGDVMEDVRYLQDEMEIPVASVAGNCDVFSRHHREIVLPLEGKRFLLVHGDKFGVKYGYERLSYYAEEKMVDAALFGHTHSAFIGMVGNALLINPGALRNGSMCFMDVSAKDIVPRIIDIDKWFNERI